MKLGARTQIEIIGKVGLENHLQARMGEASAS